MINIHVKRSKTRFLDFLAISIRKKTFFFSYWLAAFFYQFYLHKKLKKSKIDFLFLPGS